MTGGDLEIDGRNAMTIPGFSAETALGGAAHYRGQRKSSRTELRVQMADFVDQACLAGCLKNCGLECAGTSGMGKASCIQACAQDNRDCRAACTRPGDPPGGGGGGGGGAPNPCEVPCANGACCSAAFPNCSSVGGQTVCCPPGFPVARDIPFIGIRCFPF